MRWATSWTHLETQRAAEKQRWKTAFSGIGIVRAIMESTDRKIRQL